MSDEKLFSVKREYMRNASHRDLVVRAGKWLRGRGCNAVLLEPSYGSLGEIPDAIGFQASTGSSIIVEAKTSRADFLRDGNKRHRQRGAQLGRSRYYMAPKHMISPDELPDGWGLIEVSGKCGESSPIREEVPTLDHGADEKRTFAERRLLMATVAAVQWQQNNWFPPRSEHAENNLGQAASDVEIRDKLCAELAKALETGYTHSNWTAALQLVRSMGKRLSRSDREVRELRQKLREDESA